MGDYALDLDRRTWTLPDGRTLRGYQSEALQVLSLCVEAGCIGGYASYVHACDVAGLTAIIPETASDPASGPVWGMTRPHLTLADMEYWQWWTVARPPDLVPVSPNVYRNPGMQALFTNVLERLLFTHQLVVSGGQGALGALNRMAGIWRTGHGRYAIPRGTYTAHVVASLCHVALQAYAMYDDTGRYADEYTPDGVLVGLMRYMEYLDAHDERARAESEAYRKLRALREYLPYWQHVRRMRADHDITPRLALVRGRYVVTTPAVKPEPKRPRHVSQLNNARMRKARR